MQFEIGTRVIVIRGFSFGRRDVVTEIYKNNLGTTLYVLARGGCFSAPELKRE
jgi:hypothetical protein